MKIRERSWLGQLLIWLKLKRKTIYTGKRVVIRVNGVEVAYSSDLFKDVSYEPIKVLGKIEIEEDK